MSWTEIVTARATVAMREHPINVERVLRCTRPSLWGPQQVWMTRVKPAADLSAGSHEQPMSRGQYVPYRTDEGVPD
jgi:hypothetical protein